MIRFLNTKVKELAYEFYSTFYGIQVQHMNSKLWNKTILFILLFWYCNNDTRDNVASDRLLTFNCFQSYVDTFTSNIEREIVTSQMYL